MDPDVEVEILFKITEFLFVAIRSKESYDSSLKEAVQNVLNETESITVQNMRSRLQLPRVLEELAQVLQNAFGEANKKGSFLETYSEIRQKIEDEIVFKRNINKFPMELTPKILKAKKNLRF